MNRVDANQLDEDYTAGGAPIVTWQEAPFTGVAFETSPQGTLWSEQAYADGMLDGVSKDWHPNGQLRSQTDYKWNRVHGRSQHWHANGQLARDSVVELGVAVRRQQWDAAGNQWEDYRIEEDPAQLTDLAREKALFQQYEIGAGKTGE